jgi:hypothetical protein
MLLAGVIVITVWAGVNLLMGLLLAGLGLW